jgi:hypothetical protein
MINFNGTPTVAIAKLDDPEEETGYHWVLVVHWAGKRVLWQAVPGVPETLIVLGLWCQTVGAPSEAQELLKRTAMACVTRALYDDYNCDQ